MIRTLSVLVVLSLATLALVHPGGEAERVSAPAEPIKLTFWIPGSDQITEQYFIDAAAAYSKAHPNVTVEATILPPAAPDVNTKLNAAKLSGTYPDVFSAFIVFIGTRGTRGEFLDLKPYIDAWADKSDIFESSFNLGVYKGKIYGISYYPAPEVLVYRKDFFREAGIDPERPPRNWQDLESYSVKLVRRDANNNVVRAGLDIPVINPEVFIKPFLWQNGAQVIDEDKEAPVLNDPNAVEAMAFVKRLVDQNLSIPFNYQKKEDIPFVKGSSAMSFVMASTIVNMLDKNPDMKDKVGFAMPIENKNKVPFCGHRLFTIGADSKQKEASWEFIKFMMSKDEMLKRAKTLDMPVVRKSLEQEYLKSNPEFNKVVLEYAKYGRSAEVSSFTAISNKYLAEAYQAVYSGKKDPKKALEDAQEGILKDIKK